MTRRPFDAYFTPESAVKTLLEHVHIRGFVMEPCAGEGAIAKPLLGHGCHVLTNDLNPSMPALMHHDATNHEWWRRGKGVDWVVSNPPFNRAAIITKYAHQHARIGVAMLLRLSFLEPCEDRADFLSQHPPTALIVLPRISFTNDGKTDSVTCAWMVWSKQCQETVIRIVPKEKRRAVA